MRRAIAHTVMLLAAAAMLTLVGGCGEDAAVDDTVQVPQEETVWQEEEAPDIREVEEGKPAPDFTVPLVGGGEASLSDYEGKVLVLDFWATWCTACVDEFPAYQKLYDSWDKHRVGYIAMSTDGDMSVVKAFLEGHREWTMPMAVPDEAVIEAYIPTRTLPSSRVIDQNGIVRYEFKGAGAEKVAEAVRRLLEEGASEADGA